MQLADLKSLLAPQHRLHLFDVAVMFINLVLMYLLAQSVATLAQDAQQGVVLARVAEVGYFALLCFLQPVGLMLKRRGAHQRKRDISLGGTDGCLSLITFFTHAMFLLFASLLLVEILQDVTGKTWSSALFAPLFLGVPAVAAVNTAAFYFYFVRPKHEPLFPFLSNPRAEALGDAVLFVYIALNQGLWWYLLADPYFSSRPEGFNGFLDRLFGFAAMALLFYFLPRLAYLTDDISPGRTLVTMLLANAPIILRVFFGAGQRVILN